MVPALMVSRGMVSQSLCRGSELFVPGMVRVSEIPTTAASAGAVTAIVGAQLRRRIDGLTMRSARAASRRRLKSASALGQVASINQRSGVCRAERSGTDNQSQRNSNNRYTYHLRLLIRLEAPRSQRETKTCHRSVR